MSTRIQAYFVLVSAMLSCLACNRTATEPTGPSGPSGPSAGVEPARADVKRDASSTSPATAAGKEKEEPPPARLEPFNPPSLAELDAKAEWMAQPVLSALDLLRKEQAKSQPLVTVEEALRLRNDGKEANLKILSALGRLPDSESQVDFDATVIRRLRGDVKTTNALLQSSVDDVDAAGLIHVGFFSFDWNMEPFATSDTVKSWHTSKDRLYDKLVIRDDLVWSDGRPITAHDIVFSFQTIMDPDIPIPAVRTGTDQMRWVHAYDDFTVVFFHKQPSPTNVWNVNFPVVPKHIYEKSLQEDKTLQNSPYHVQLENQPVCGGAYILKRRVRGQELVFERREDYYMRNGKQVRPKEHFKEVRLRVITDSNTALLALRAGETDEMDLDAEQWQTEQTKNDEFYARNTKATGTEWLEFHVIWNCKTPFFSDKRVRTAMSYAIDHDELLNKVFYGLYEPATGPFHYASWMAPKKPSPPYKQDLDKAEQLLEQAGWTDSNGDGIRDKVIGGQSVPFEFTLNCGQTPVSFKVCELVKESLDRIGVICNAKPLEWTVLQQQLHDNKFQASFGGWSTGTDPSTTENIFGSKGERNYGQYENPEVDRLFAEGLKEFDKEKRAALYARIHEILYEDQAYTWLYYRNAFYGFNKSLRGYKFSPRGPYHYGPGFSSVWKPVAAQ